MSEQDDLAAAIGTDPAIDGSGDSGNPGELYHGYSVDDEDQPQDTGDSLTDARGVTEPLEEGYSPPEKWSAGQKWGNTPLEEELGETLDQRIAQEIPEPAPCAQAEPKAEAGLLKDDPSPEAGGSRAGRLVEPDRGVNLDVEGSLLAD